MRLLILRLQFNIDVDQSSRYRSTFYDAIATNRGHDYSDYQQDDFEYQIYNRQW